MTSSPAEALERTVQLDGWEVTQAIQDLGGSVPLIRGKGTFVRVYLAPSSGAMLVRGELEVSRNPNGPWTEVDQFENPSNDTNPLGTAILDASRKGATLADLRSRRENFDFSLNFKLPSAFTRNTVWYRLSKVRETSSLTSGSSSNILVANKPPAQSVTFISGDALLLNVINLRYTNGTPPTTHQARHVELDLLNSWLVRAYPVSSVVFSFRTVGANGWTLNPADAENAAAVQSANAQVAAIRQMDMSTGGNPLTHYYGLVTDTGGFMRGKANAIPNTADPSAVASGPTGSRTYGWDFDGSYGDWYGGHELAHTFGRRHPGYCGNPVQPNNDPSYPFVNGQLSDADGAFIGFDAGDAASVNIVRLGLLPTALPGVTWHDVMTYCTHQWLSSHTYIGIHERLKEEFDQNSGSAVGGSREADVSDTSVHIVVPVNLTARTGEIAYVTPVPGSPISPPPRDEARLTLRIQMRDGTTYRQPVALKLDACRVPDQDENGLVDVVVEVDPEAVALDLLLDEDPIAHFEPGTTPVIAGNVHVERREDVDATARDEDGVTVEEMLLRWDDSEDTTGTSYTVQASTDHGQTWITLAVGLTDTSLLLEPLNFADAEQVRFRVFTSNGFTRTESATEDFLVDEL